MQILMTYQPNNFRYGIAKTEIHENEHGKFLSYTCNDAEIFTIPNDLINIDLLAHCEPFPKGGKDVS